MSRKVNLTVKAKVLVPIILKYNVVANADEGVPMERIARAAIQGKVPNGADIEDSSFEIESVEGADATQIDQCDIDEQISDYVEGEEGVNPAYLTHEVTDSR